MPTRPSRIRLEDLARACQQYGLALPHGHISHTGIGGITLGGGMGWYQRQHGLMPAIEAAVDAMTRATSPFASVICARMGGAMQSG